MHRKCHEKGPLYSPVYGEWRRRVTGELTYGTKWRPLGRTTRYQLTNAFREVLRSLRVPGMPRPPAMHIWNRTQNTFTLSRQTAEEYWLYFVLCTLYFVLCTLYFVLCTLYFVLCTLFLESNCQVNNMHIKAAFVLHCFFFSNESNRLDVPNSSQRTEKNCPDFRSHANWGT